MRGRFFLATFAAANLGLVIYGAMALAAPAALLNGEVLQALELPQSAGATLGYLAGLFRLLGFFNFCLGCVGLLLLVRYAIAGEVWILRALIAVSLLSYAGPIVFDVTAGTVGEFEVVEMVLFAAMLLAVIQRRSVPSGEGDRRAADESKEAP